MSPLVSLLILLLSVGAFALAAWWLERFTRHTGIALAIGGGAVVLGGALVFVLRPHWYPVLLVANGLGLLYVYRWRRKVVREERSTANRA